MRWSPRRWRYCESSHLRIELEKDLLGEVWRSFDDFRNRATNLHALAEFPHVHVVEDGRTKLWKVEDGVTGLEVVDVAVFGHSLGHVAKVEESGVEGVRASSDRRRMGAGRGMNDLQIC